METGNFIAVEKNRCGSHNFALESKYALFFDIDGTLVSFKTHEIPSSTVFAGIAMGNALDSLKQEADYTTTSVDEDGILNALRHFNLI